MEEPPPTGRIFHGPRCAARSKQSGVQCGNPAIPGGTTCRFHGSGTAAAQAKARLRLLELVDPATAVLAQILTDPKAKANDRLRAVENIYDRAGIPRRTEVDAIAAKELLMDRIQEVLARRVGPDVVLPTDGLPELPAGADTVPGEIVPDERMEA